MYTTKHRNLVTNQLRCDRKSYEAKLAKESKNNSKRLFACCWNKSKSKANSCNIKKYGGSFTSTDDDAADTLNDHFTEVFNKESEGVMPDFPDRVGSDEELPLFDISEDETGKVDGETYLLTWTVIRTPLTWTATLDCEVCRQI